MSYAYWVVFSFGIQSIIIYVSGFVSVCTANPASLKACLNVGSYMPGYFYDLVEFVRFEPYEREKTYLRSFWHKFLKPIYVYGTAAKTPIGGARP